MDAGPQGSVGQLGAEIEFDAGLNHAPAGAVNEVFAVKLVGEVGE
jgi:hypothetical protein